MFEIEKILVSPFGSFASIAALFIFALWFVHWITKKITEIRVSHEHLEKENTKTSEKIDLFCEKNDKHMDEIRKDILYLKAIIDVFKLNSSQSVAESHSPVSLTETGKTIAKELNAEKMIANNWDKIFSAIEVNIKDKNAYDIQEYCIETATVELDKFLVKTDIEKVKDYAYKEGKPLAYFAPIFAILIRDKYIQIKGNEIKVDDRF